MERGGEERREEEEGEGEERRGPTLFSLTNHMGEGELAPPSLGGQGSARSLWTVHGRDTDELPKYPDTAPASAQTTCAYAGSRKVLCSAISPSDCKDRNQQRPYPSATGTLLVKQKKRTLSSASTFLCCSQRTIHYPAFRSSAAFFQQPDISFAPGM